jgi:hypothetical protein
MFNAGRPLCDSAYQREMANPLYVAAIVPPEIAPIVAPGPAAPLTKGQPPIKRIDESIFECRRSHAVGQGAGELRPAPVHCASG